MNEAQLKRELCLKYREIITAGRYATSKVKMKARVGLSDPSGKLGGIDLYRRGEEIGTTALEGTKHHQ